MKNKRLGMRTMEKEAIHELFHYHDKNMKNRCKDFLKKAAGRYVPPKDDIFWDIGLLANGLMELWIRREWSVRNRIGDVQAGSGRQREGNQEDKILPALRKYFDRWIRKKMPVYYLDDALCGVVLLWLYEVTAEEKYKIGADRLADYLQDLAKKEADAAGSIPYRPAQKNGHVYVDGIGMMCPFLAMYGVKCGEEKALHLALEQIYNMLEYGMDEKTGLPYHGFQYEKREKCGIIGWGRAVGWFLMGMKGVLCQLSMEAEEYGKLEDSFWKLLVAAMSYQREDGGFSWQLEAMEGPADSSATAMIAQAMQFGVNLRIAQTRKEEVERRLRLAIVFLEESEKDGKIFKCLGECMGFSQYPQVYGAYPWSLGTALGLMEGGRPGGKIKI